MSQNWFVMQPMNSGYPIQLSPFQPQASYPYNPSLLWPTGAPMQPIYLAVQPTSMEDMVGYTQDPGFRFQQSLISGVPQPDFPSGLSSTRSNLSVRRDNDKDESQGSRDLLKLRRRKPLEHLKKESQGAYRSYRQNPSRNIVTNIGNQLITYLCSPGKSEARIRQLRPHYTRQDVDAFYTFTRKVKKETDYYLNMQKMQSFWYPEKSDSTPEDFQKLLRILSAYFMAELLPPCILTSTKMKRETKLHHMRVRKQLLSLLCRRTAFLPRAIANFDHLYKTE